MHVYSLFLFIVEQYYIAGMYYSLLIHLSIEGLLGCFQFLAFMNRAAINFVYRFLCEDKCSGPNWGPQEDMPMSSTLETVTVTLSGKRIFADVIKLGS